MFVLAREICPTETRSVAFVRFGHDAALRHTADAQRFVVTGVTKRVSEATIFGKSRADSNHLPLPLVCLVVVQLFHLAKLCFIIYQYRHCFAQFLLSLSTLIVIECELDP
jgi:hypothetical protein